MTPDSIKISDVFWIALDKLNINRSTLIKQAELPLAIAHKGARIKIVDLFKLWRALEQLGGPDIGFRLVAAIDSNNMPLSSLVAYYAKNLRDAIYRIVRYKSLCTPEELKIIETHEYLSINIAWPLKDAIAPDALIDVTISVLIGLAQKSSVTKLQPAKIILTRPKSSLIDSLYHCPVQWNAKKNEIFFYQRDLDLPLKHSNQELLKILDKTLQSELHDLTSKLTFSDQVKWLIRKSLTAGRPDLHSVAKEIGISERSLQRYLKNEGVSFQSLLSSIRHELACEYLMDKRLNLAGIAYLLGYEEQASLFRSFQEWEGTTPKKWRELHLSKV
ncbi:AraC family transcriptional regulator [Acinetobacter baumannii]|uniref:AraC family transcriptional regulator n=1 Tax=Acinetobacter baumannii TaxID=470 RepID=UPI0002CF5062|nr:AraC family transcriptional regulator [Acinetobacter baumannii]ENW33421.1 hypothetical protein F922_03212 [Acinetobacter baumannii NIPH 201]HDX6152507.1 helix-turn-helix domain-containing protein [Acinetobacter baumannii]